MGIATNAAGGGMMTPRDYCPLPTEPTDVHHSMSQTMKIRMIRSTLLCLLLLAIWTPSFARTPAALVGIPSVVDADTLELHGQRIRLWGVDAPESAQRCTLRDGKQWRCGTAAANALSSYIAGRTVTCAARDEDRYGRTVASCSVAKVDLGTWLVSNGWALAYRRYSKSSYVGAEAGAIANRRGIHSSQFEAPWDFRKNKQNKSGARYRSHGSAP